VKDDGPHYMTVSTLLLLSLRSRYCHWHHSFFKHYQRTLFLWQGTAR